MVYGLVFKVAAVSRDQSKNISIDWLEPQNLKQGNSLESFDCLYLGLHIIQLWRGRADTCLDVLPDFLKYENNFISGSLVWVHLQFQDYTAVDGQGQKDKGYMEE